MKQKNEMLSNNNLKTITIANHYHEQAIGLFNLAMTYSKDAMAIAHQNSKELLSAKDIATAQQLIINNLTGQIAESSNFTKAAQQFIGEGHKKLNNVCQEQIKESTDLISHCLSAEELAAHPLTEMSLKFAQSLLHSNTSAFKAVNDHVKNGALNS